MKKLILVFMIIVSVYPLFAEEAYFNSDIRSKILKHVDGLEDGGMFNLTFKSRLDSSQQPLLLKIPKGYSSEKKWPLLVVLHGRGGNPIVVDAIDSILQIGPFGRGDTYYKELGEKDVFECIEIAKEIFNVDTDRIYLSGFSMGAIGTFELGLKYPDLWAGCVPVCGRLSNLSLIENGRNLPFWINSGSQDTVISPQSSRDVYEKALEIGFDNWKYTEHEDMGHNFSIDWSSVEKWLLTQKRISNPANIVYNCDVPASIYWADIKVLKDKTKRATIKIAVNGQSIEIVSDNISDYTLNLKDCPIDCSKSISVVENGQELFNGHLKEKVFKKQSINLTKKS